MRRFSTFIICLAAWFSVVACVVFSNGPGEDSRWESFDQVPPGEIFTLEKGETVKISAEPLIISLEGVGREWTEEDEYAYADLTIQLDGEETSFSLYVGEEWQIGTYVIYLSSANPFGEITSCGLMVTEKTQP